MALILLRDVSQGRGRVINTCNIFHAVEVEGGVRVNYTEGSIGRDHVVIAGTLEEFAKAVEALQVG
ncbi:MAG: hypothetical protein NT015_18600 [Alphaproteobacteria bacterium]|nr:hypothetical protein [Alphaproteobacteria bacterium]